MNLNAIITQRPGNIRSPALASRWLASLADRAGAEPNAVAVVEIGPEGRPGRTITRSGLLRLAELRARALAQALPADSTVLAALPSGIDLAAWFIASIGAGLRLVLMHPQCGDGELRTVAAKTGAAVILTREGARRAGGGARMSVDVGAGRDSGTEPGNAAFPDRAPGSVILGSSGTTGLPKLALRGSASLDADAVAVATGMDLTCDDTVLCVPPLSHSYGVDILLGALYSGAALHIMAEFDAAAAAAQIRSGISVLPGLPFLYESLLRVDPCPCPRLRLALSAGSSLSPRVREGFCARWGVSIGQLYGATELGTVAISRPDRSEFDPLSIGRPLDGVSFRILDPADPAKVLPPGQIGQLAVRAPSMLCGYLGDDVPLADGHFLTGDLARADSKGRVTITGRLKLLMDIGGFKVNPLEVEAALGEHPGIADCAVASLPLSDTIRRVRAFVVPVDAAHPPAERDLRQFLKDRLAPNKVPRVFEIVAALPRSPLGKLLRDKLPGGGC